MKLKFYDYNNNKYVDYEQKKNKISAFESIVKMQSKRGEKPNKPSKYEIKKDLAGYIKDVKILNFLIEKLSRSELLDNFYDVEVLDTFKNGKNKFLWTIDELKVNDFLKEYLFNDDVKKFLEEDEEWFIDNVKKEDDVKRTKIDQKEKEEKEKEELRKTIKETDIEECIRKDDVKQMKIFMAIGIDPNSRMENDEMYNGCSMLNFAVFEDAIGIVDVLLKNGADVNAKDKKGYTALNTVTGKNQISVEIVKKLLKAGADVNARTSYDDTALIKLSLGDCYYPKSSAEIIKLLLEAGADVNAKNKHGDTALIKAQFFGIPECVKILLEAGADVNARASWGETPIKEAAEKGHKEAVKLLLEAGADVNTKDILGNTALILAAMNGFPEVVKLLLEANADVNDKNRYGNTALMEAAEKGRKEAVRLLLEAGAEIDPNDTKTMQFIVDNNLDSLVA